MTGNKAYLAEYQDYNGGPIAFGGSKGYITDKGKIKTRKLDFEDVCFVKELQYFNLFSVSQMCDKKNKCKEASTPIETQKPLVKDEEASDVDVSGHSKTSIKMLMKRIFRYLKGKPKLGLWYPRCHHFDLGAYLDSEYVGAKIDRKSTTKERVIGKENKMVLGRTVVCQTFHSLVKKVRTDISKVNTDNGKERTAIKTDGENTPRSSSMAVLESCPKHNMVAYLEKTMGKTSFRYISSYAKAQTLSTHCILLPKVAGKHVSISSGINKLSDLPFDDADRIDSWPNRSYI
ncbi:hypothetical protein Tco_0957081 [Tanacetum coccineum]